MMGLEGLQVILDKEEVVSTPLASDMLDHPVRIEESFRRHVRTYIPIGRQGTGGEPGLGVADFERRVIRDVREGRAIAGYITGEYGYGKTSTALYLWERAREERLLAVPPFRLQNLRDLVIASYGWTCYELARIRPDLLPKAQTIYEAVVDRSAEAFAERYRMNLSDAQRLLQEQPEMLRLSAADYIRFIEALTRLAQEAGFAGLLILADELQQYIEPAAHSGQRDLISALFDLIEAIRVRRGQLPFGLLLIIPPKDLSLLRDQRGDLVHRMLQTSLDLNTIYDRWFPQRLWNRLAVTFAFEDHRDRIISHECLDALGQIAARGDLSDGPRTVINVFRRATQRYIAAGHPEDAPYSPENLIDDFLSGAITFDSARRIPQITAQALNHSMVKGHPLRERAIKWAAAFPQEGLPRALQERLGLTEAIDELARSVLNDLLIEVGDRRSGGVTLRGLDHVGVQTDWLTTTIREFWRVFDQDQGQSRRWVTGAFLSLLTVKVFPSNQWRSSKAPESDLFASTEVIFEGCFNAARQRFPDRRIVVYALWQDDPEPDRNEEADVAVVFRLYAEREGIPSPNRGPLRIDVRKRRIEVALDLMRRDDSLVSPSIDQFVRPVILSTHLTPYLLLGMYQFLDEKRTNNLIPKQDQQFVQFAFQSALLDVAFDILFHPGLDESGSVGRERLIETALFKLLGELYGEYVTLIRTGQWNSALQKYINVLQRHDLTYERQGKLPIEGVKREIASMFGLSDTGFDNFVENFDTLIKIERPFPTRATARSGAKGAVRLTLHPLEQKILGWIQEAPEVTLSTAKESHFPRRGLPLSEVRRRARELGYLPQEIEMGVKLLKARQLVEEDPQRDVLYEKSLTAPSLNEIDRILAELEHDLAILGQAFPASPQIAQSQREVGEFRCELNEKLRMRPDDRRALEIKSQILSFRRLLAAFAEEQQRNLCDKIDQRRRALPKLDRQVAIKLGVPLHEKVPFVQTLNTLRAAALTQYEALNGALSRMGERLDALQRTLQREELSFDTLAQSAVEFARHEQEIDTLHQQSTEFIQQARILEDWLDLVERASQLGGELQLLGDGASAYRVAFDRWVRSVEDALVNQTYGRIGEATDVRRDLDKLTNAVKREVIAARQRFAEKQTCYRKVIEEQLGVSQEMLWPLHQYDPQAAKESESRLLADVKAAIQRWCARTGETIRRLQTDIRSTLDSSHIAALSGDERRRLQEQGARLAADLRALGRELMDYEGRSEDLAILHDLPPEGGGRFRELMHSIGQLRTTLAHIHQEVETLQKGLKELCLTPSEEILLAALSSGDASVEIADLRSMTGSLTEVDFWNALRGLHAKRRIRMYCERLVNE